MVEFSHIQDDKVHMVDISEKGDVGREAVASGRIYLRDETLRAISEGAVLKGNVLATARIAAIMAVKNTAGLIPMCHTIPISTASVDFIQEKDHILARVRVKSYGRTGVEMEALTGAGIALLTIWDMVKSAEKDSGGQYPVTRITDLIVEEKRKGV
jgi:molybdenum cofactor biosynthesis protein MoaC